MSYFDNYTSQEIEQIISQSSSWKDFARRLGYSWTPSGATITYLQKKAENFDTSHFYKSLNQQVKRSEENIFVKDTTAAQTTLRDWYKKGNYTEYKCSICGQEPIWQGKELTLILDHIDGDNRNGVLENLRWVCPNCNQQLETTGSRNYKGKKPIKKYYCVDCGKEISKGSVRCLECEAKTRIVPLDKMPVTRKELKALIRTIPFTQIGMMYGVTDNSIRKWCDKFSLPRKATEIKKYTDEEWEKI